MASAKFKPKHKTMASNSTHAAAKSEGLNHNILSSLKFTSLYTNAINLLSITAIGLILILTIAMSFASTSNDGGADNPYCKGVYMSPAYAKIHAFDLTHTKYASKYSLYLYREQGLDTLPDDSGNFSLSGTPVLFIPGNAGSYKQVRSVAAESANQYFKNIDFIKDVNINSNNLDFFSADFNEDFTAFHGRTMLDQSEYLNDAVKFILSLYESNTSAKIPTSVILLGHSMGGIVARVMLSLPNYKEGSVNTIITLSTPHNAPPTTFDGDLLNVSKLTDDFWRNGFVDEILEQPSTSKLRKIARKRLENVSLISITGGSLDTTLPTDYTTLIGLVPETHGFSVSTTGIPGVWTPIDHLAIVWCDQLRKVLAKTLLLIVNKNLPSQTYPLKKRLEIFKSNLLPGFDKSLDIIKDAQRGVNIPYKLKIDLKQLKDSTNQRFFQLPKKIQKRDGNNSPPINLFNIPKDEPYKFNFISSLRPSSIEELDELLSPSILLCRSVLSEDLHEDDYYKEYYDYTSDNTLKYAELECIDINHYSYMIPKSYTNMKAYYSMEVHSKILSSFNNIIIVEPNSYASPFDDDDFVLADLQLEKSSTLNIGDSSLWKLMTRGYDITIPAHRPIIIDIDIPSIKSSLLAYSLDVRYSRSKNEKFSPAISQSINVETKWHLDVGSNKFITSIVNANSPYTPFIVDDPNSHARFKIFSDSLASDQLMDIYISIDWYKSLKLLVVKYRLSIIGFPLFFTLLIITVQFIFYSKHNKYPSYGEVMLYLCGYKIMASLLLIFSFLSSLTSSTSVWSKLVDVLDPVERNDLGLMTIIERTRVEINSIFMGIDEPSLWFYGVFVLMISIALNFVLYNLVLLLLSLLLKLAKVRFWSWLKFPRYQYFSNQRKTLSIIALVLLVLLYLPFQFAYIVCVLTQVLSTLHSFTESPSLNAYQTSIFNGPFTVPHKLKTQSEEGEEDEEEEENDDETIGYTGISSKKSALLLENFKNFQLSFTILMLWLIPINVPVLIVWIHDISLKWRTPFSSHHNILAVLPIIILIQMLNQGYMISRPKNKFTYLTTVGFISYFCIYSLLFGTRHLYFLHSLFNMTCVWFLILMVQDWGNGKLEMVSCCSPVMNKNSSKIS